MRNTYPWNAEDKSVSISEVIGRSLNEREGGVTECAQATANNIAQMLAMLIEKLHERGCLSDDDLKPFISGYEILK